MPAAQEYLDRANRVKDSCQMPDQLTGAEQAKQLKVAIIAAQKELRQIKRQVALEMKEIRLEYKDKATGAGSTGGTVLSLLGKRGAGKSYQAASKRNINRQRDNALAPYEKIKGIIDQYLLAYDKVKVQIDQYLIKLKG
jgi:hypothetical protein